MRTRSSVQGIVLLGGSLLLVPTPTHAQNAPKLDSAPATEATAQPDDAAPPIKPEEVPVRAMLKALVDAYNAKDLDGIGKLITDEITLIDAEGTVTSGRDAVLEQYASSFEESPMATIEGSLESLRFLTPDVARGEGGFLLDSAPGVLDPTAGRFALLAIHGSDGAWRLAEMHDYPAPPPEPPSAPEILAELDWMIGDWIDETDSARISSSIRWILDNNYMVREYSIEIPGEPSTTGVMILGYDPQAEQIKSWVFDSRGGHGEAYWSRADDNQWVLKAKGYLSDGSPTSATQVMTLLSPDMVRHSSLDRIIGGVVRPDISEVVMVRKPPAPDTPPAETEAETPEPVTPREPEEGADPGTSDTPSNPSPDR